MLLYFMQSAEMMLHTTLHCIALHPHLLPNGQERRGGGEMDTSPFSLAIEPLADFPDAVPYVDKPISYS